VYSKGLRGLSTRLAHCLGDPSQRPSTTPPLLPSPSTSPLSFLYAEETEGPPLELPEGVTLEQMMQRLERQLIESTLRRCGNHKDRAAKELGLARSSLFKRLKEWGLGQGEE